MLYDPKWEQKADPFKLETLIAWLEMQPASQSYDYGCCGHCLLAQYFTANGHPVRSMGSRTFLSGGNIHNLSEDFNNIALARGNRDADRWTFGAALKRARKLAA